MVFEREVPCLSPRDIFIQYLRRALREILQQVSNGIENDCISFRLEQIIEVLLRSTSVFQDGGQLLSVLRRALVIVQGPPEVASTAPTPLLYSGAKGRPRVEIQPEALKFLLEFGFKAGEIATMFCVSIRTIQRRMANFNIREDIPRYTPISDNQLDETCRQITSEFPNCGVRRMRGFLLARNIRVSWERTREAMRRIDPQGVLLRSLQLNIVNRRVYSVRVALALWHMDSNHKLIRYKFFLTNCIYTYGWGMR